ncbi:unnamed protein product [Prorocentrum cordatum]|uniref:CUB domain-containing protein n=1 Tax=Prorocentrum cordatum TaxID=2364126 RepID=A0ABN9QNQ1_9DINO|nr:unnamed protein product [Polarella glacialis]
MPIQVESFYTEAYFDTLLVNGVFYSGAVGPNAIIPSTDIIWFSDTDWSRVGWRLCADFPPASALPTPVPSSADAPPAPVPATPAPMHMWAAVSGECSLNGTCVESPNFPQNYGVDQTCILEINFELAGPIHVESFNTETYFDYLLVNDVKYFGTNGPHGITPSSSVFWCSDTHVAQSGWRLCADALTFSPSETPNFWSRVSGPCTAYSGCVRSPNYPLIYGEDHLCTIELAAPSVTISVTSFHSENYADWILIDGVEYSGFDGISGTMDVSSTIVWSADHSIQKTGWEICRAAGCQSGPIFYCEFSVVICDGVTEIPGSSFQSCENLSQVHIPHSVTSIGNSAFANCISLKHVDISNSSVVAIGHSAFRSCTSLVDLDMPDSVTYVGPFAFYQCSSLRSVNISLSATSIGESSFSGCTSLSEVNVPGSVTYVGPWAFYSCSALRRVHSWLPYQCHR